MAKQKKSRLAAPLSDGNLAFLFADGGVIIVAAASGVIIGGRQSEKSRVAAVVPPCNLIGCRGSDDDC